jgi:hypothetical protein
LYQWNFEDDDHWHAFAGGANGVIDAASGFVTIDSIWLSGSGEAVLYLDTVSHNPDGPLTAVGDFNGDGVVDSLDLAAWGEGAGAAAGATFDDGDGDGDGDVDGGDFLGWQRTLGMSNTLNIVSAAAVPEPSGALMIGAALFALSVLRRAPLD